MLVNAFEVVGIALDGVLSMFARLFDAFDLSLVVFPLMAISVIFGLIVSPIIGYSNHMRREFVVSRVFPKSKKNKRNSKGEDSVE